MSKWRERGIAHSLNKIETKSIMTLIKFCCN